MYVKIKKMGISVAKYYFQKNNYSAALWQAAKIVG